MRAAILLILLHAAAWPQDYAQIQKLRDQAKSAFNREMAREKADDCKDAVTTYDINVCLSKANDATTTNYKAYTQALRLLLASQAQPEFDQAQTAWEQYRKLQCSAAYALFKGGTIAPSMELSCNLLLMRSHLRELNAIYETTLNN